MLRSPAVLAAKQLLNYTRFLIGFNFFIAIYIVMARLVTTSVESVGGYLAFIAINPMAVCVTQAAIWAVMRVPRRHSPNNTHGGGPHAYGAGGVSVNGHAPKIISRVGGPHGESRLHGGTPGSPPQAAVTHSAGNGNGNGHGYISHHNSVNNMNHNNNNNNNMGSPNNHYVKIVSPHSGHHVNMAWPATANGVANGTNGNGHGDGNGIAATAPGSPLPPQSASSAGRSEHTLHTTASSGL